MNDNNTAKPSSSERIRELKIDSTLWATPAKIINLLDFKPEKLSIDTEINTNNDIKVHQVTYENGGFYLTIDNIKVYFNISNNISMLDMIFSNNDQRINIIKYGSLIEKDNKFHLELSLLHCLYEI